jgi:alanine racemase
MVMSPDEHSFDVLINYNLEPEIFSFDIFYSFQQFLIKEGIPQYPIHLKLNTGMNRLGFEPHEINTLTTSIIEKQQVIVKSVFSHLVASEEAALDEFTQQQVNLFSTCCFELEQQLGYTVIKHIANTAAIARNPAYQLDMVRLGIGLYGIDSAVSDKFNLQQVATLKTTVAQIRKVLAGDTVGYGRKGILTRDSVIATVRIGYADGYSRRLGNGVGKMFINGAYAPVIGNVCMDMTMLDITDIPDVIPGDVVEVFGNHVTIQSLAADSGTIAYEIMTGINQRVKRMYFEE